MTNHQKLETRLNQFDFTIARKKKAHGGADRCLYANQNYQELSPKLFVSIYPFEYKIKLNDPTYKRIMGDIAKLEFYCIADYLERFNNKLPRFNDPKSPKFTKEYPEEKWG